MGLLLYWGRCWGWKIMEANLNSSSGVSKWNPERRRFIKPSRIRTQPAEREKWINAWWVWNSNKCTVSMNTSSISWPVVLGYAGTDMTAYWKVFMKSTATLKELISGVVSSFGPHVSLNEAVADVVWATLNDNYWEGEDIIAAVNQVRLLRDKLHFDQEWLGTYCVCLLREWWKESYQIHTIDFSITSQKLDKQVTPLRPA
jgi:hypothetical protein